MIAYDPGRSRHVNRGGYTCCMPSAGCVAASREDIAGGAQRHLEEQAVPYIRDAIRRKGEGNVALAGGLFANVRLHQRIREIPEMTGVWIHPNTGDGGLAVGAALGLPEERTPTRRAPGGRWADV